MDEALVNTAAEVSAFIPMLLLFIFLVVLIGGSLKEKLRTGSADIPMWCTLAGVITVFASLIMTLRSGLIQLEVLVIVITITCLSGVWFFLTRNRNEV